LGDSKFVDLLRTVSTCNRKINDACVSKIEYKIYTKCLTKNIKENFVKKYVNCVKNVNIVGK